MQIGLFGGTFNPVHLGHLRAAVEVKEGFELDEVFLIPAALPPHKMPGGVAAAADRLQMLDWASEDVSGLIISNVELNRSGPSYTIDTVQHFKCSMPNGSQIYLIMGTDTFFEIHTWKSYEELLAQIPLIVIPRPMADIQYGFVWKAMEDYIKTKISADYEFSKSRSCFLRIKKPPIFVHEITAIQISATMIRKLIKRGRSIDYLVPQKVAEFIKSKGLYL
jgi:nicotinate-nucleotide adenylyltransferase